MNYWKRASFWTKIKDTVGGILALGQLSLVLGNAQHIYNGILFIGQAVALFIPIWMEDKNQNDIADIFEKEVKVTIKSDSPITTETTIEKKEP